MSRKGSHTTTTYLEWEKANYLVNLLERQQDNRFALLIGIGIYTGLRIGDILSIKWEQLEKDTLTLNENKTRKYREVTFNKQLLDLIARVRLKAKPESGDYVFINRYAVKPISIQYVNTRLKQIFKSNKISLPSVSSHLMRKTFGRRVWDVNNRSEESLLKLSEVYSHSSVAITKRYLGIRSEEIADVYLSI